MAPLRSLGNILSAFDDFYARTGKDAVTPAPPPDPPDPAFTLNPPAPPPPANHPSPDGPGVPIGEGLPAIKH